jgi:hypothetical protein
MKLSSKANVDEIDSKTNFKSQSASSKEKFGPTNNLSTDYNTAVEGQPLHTALDHLFSKPLF